MALPFRIAPTAHDLCARWPHLTHNNIGGTLGVAKGGTGVTTLTGYIKGAGTTAFTASATIPSTDITGLGTIASQAASNVAITGGMISE